MGKGAVDMTYTHIDLSKDELVVLKWMALGKDENDIADLSGISAKDIQPEIKRISEKLETRNRVEASVKAIKLGLV